MRAALLLLLASVASASAVQDKKKDDGGIQPDGLKNLQHADPNVRYRTAAILAEQGPRARFAIEALRDALMDTDPLVRVKVAEALWMVERPSPGVVLPTLQRALKDKNPQVRAAACAVMGVMGAKAKTAVPALMATLKDGDVSVTIAAVCALGDIGPPAHESAEALLQLSGFGDFALLEAVVSAALGSMGEPVVPQLITTLKHPSLERRRVAAYALGTIGPDARTATTPLTRMLGDEQAILRLFAARALGNIGKDAKSALPRLGNATTDKDVQVRIQAALAVWQIGGQADHVMLIADALREKSLGAREAACQALAAIGPGARDATPALTRALKDPEPVIKQAAALALASIGPPAGAAAPTLRLLLRDEDKALRLHAAAALWRVTGDAKEALAALRPALTDEPRVQAVAVEKLGTMGPAARELLPDLVAMYREEDNVTMRRSIGETIKKIDAAVAAKLGVR
jgi:HEAT repeat protein